ncbi:MAG: hypothetical protein RLN72_08430 [Henriciella sp.]
MTSVIKAIFQFGPLIFAFGFLMPLTAQAISAAGWTLPFGMTPLWAGFIIAALLGLTAQIRGRWL